MHGKQPNMTRHIVQYNASRAFDATFVHICLLPMLLLLLLFFCCLLDSNSTGSIYLLKDNDIMRRRCSHIDVVHSSPRSSHHLQATSSGRKHFRRYLCIRAYDGSIEVLFGRLC